MAQLEPGNGKAISPYGFREGPAPSGPVDPVLIWDRARRTLGLTELATESQLAELRPVYVALCAAVKSRGENAVTGELDSSPDEVHRWDWRKEVASHQDQSGEYVYIDQAGEGVVDVTFGESGAAALTNKVQPTSAEPIEAA